MTRVKKMFAGRVALRAITLAVLAIAAVLCTLLVRDAIAPAEAKSPMAGGQGASIGTLGGVRVRFEALATERGGITGKPRMGRTDIQAIGTTASRYLAAGSEVDPSVCKASFSDIAEADRLVVWKLESRVVEVSGGRSTLQVHWTRSRAGNPVPERDDTRTMTLGRGDTHVLDYVEEQADAPSSCASLMVRIAADPILPGGSQPVTVDLWTVDENAPGGGRSVHLRVPGLSAESINYQLPPLDIAPEGANAATGHAVKMDVGGTLQAALAPDGFVDVTLTTVRRTGSGKATIQGEGRVQFRTKVGETAAVLLPEPAGRLPRPEGDGFVDVGRLFAGHRLSLYVKVEVAR